MSADTTDRGVLKRQTTARTRKAHAIAQYLEIEARRSGSDLVVYLPRAELVFLSDIGVAWLELKCGGRWLVPVGSG